MTITLEIKKLYTLITIFFTAISCSSIQKAAVSTTSDILYQGEQQLEKEATYELFERSIPSGIKSLELMLPSDPNNSTLLFSLLKGYFSYAMAIQETKLLELSLQKNDLEIGSQKDSAVMAYSRAMYYAERYLKNVGISIKDLMFLSNDKTKFRKLIRSKFSLRNDRDVAFLFFFGMTWASLINLERNNVMLMGQASTASHILGHVCDRYPDYYYGNCNIFYATNFLVRPTMFGGDVEKGRELFLKMMALVPENLFARVMYLQYYVIPHRDLGEYTKIKTYLISEFKKFISKQKWGNTVSGYEDERLNHLNAIAKKRFDIIVANEKKLEF